MYKRILMAYDGSESGQKALLDCRDIAQWGKSESSSSRSCRPWWRWSAAKAASTTRGAEDRKQATYRRVLEEGLRRLAEAGHMASGEVLIGDAVDEIAKCARRIDADLIVVGHRHLDGWAVRWWRGSRIRP